jgi:outer membrane receptor protein involved in Fe transport
MNIPKTLKPLLSLMVGPTLVFTSVSFAQEEAAVDEIVELSQFVIRADEDTGYRAASTLAGTRLRTPLKDVGSSITVLTSELFADTGATDAETILGYATGMEVHGVQGNFADGPGQRHNGRFEQDNQRLDPQNSQRVRGLSSASLTRGFFLTDIAFDSYNSDRVEINRGANSLLFGIGAPGGIINNSLTQASVDANNAGKYMIRIGERGSYRTTLDLNGVLIKDRLAVRFMGLYEDKQYQQLPAFETDKRATFAVEAVLLENKNSNILGKSMLRANFEFGTIAGTPPMLVPPHDGYSSFIEKPNLAALDATPGAVYSAYYDGAAKTYADTPSRYNPEYDYVEWRPWQTFDNRVGWNRGNMPFIGERNFHRGKIKYEYDADVAMKWGGAAAPYQYMHGLMTGAPGTHLVELDANQVPVERAAFDAAHGADVPSYAPVYINSGLAAGTGAGQLDNLANFQTTIGNILICKSACGTSDAVFGYQGYNLGKIDGVDQNRIHQSAAPLWSYVESGSFFMGNRNDQKIPNFTTPVILDKTVWDNESAMIQGLTNERKQNFDTMQITFEQPLFNWRGGVEFAYDRQHFAQFATIPFSEQESIGDTGNGDVVIDTNEYLANGAANPNVGRPHMKTDSVPDKQFREIDRESYRFTAFYKLDFAELGDSPINKLLGNHTLTGFYNKQTINTFNYNTSGIFYSINDQSGADIWDFAEPGVFNARGPRNGNKRAVMEIYLGPSVIGKAANKVKLNMIETRMPQAGDIFTALMYDRDTDNDGPDEIGHFEEHSVLFDEILSGRSRRQNQIETYVLSTQSRLFNDHIVGLFGWRRDESKTWENITGAEGDTLGIPQELDGDLSTANLHTNSLLNPDFARISDTASGIASGDTITYSIVGHVPEDMFGLGEHGIGLSGHYSKSENFQPSATRRDPYGNILGPPSGTTKEYGFTVSLFNQRVSARLNWYETAAAGASLPGGNPFDYDGWLGGFMARWWRACEVYGTGVCDPTSTTILNTAIASSNAQGRVADNTNTAKAGTSAFTTVNHVLDEIASWVPAKAQAVRNIRIDRVTGLVENEPNPGETGVHDFISTGFELDVVANITDNWRMFMNLARAEAVESNVAVQMKAIALEVTNNINASPIGGWIDSPEITEGQSFASRFLAIVGAPLGALTAREGQKTLELTEWRFNLVTTYDFTQGVLDGVSIGGGIRYQSGNAIGYPNACPATGDCNYATVIPDLKNAFFGPSRLNGDVWVGYHQPLFDGKVNWRIQLNVRNAFGDSGYIPVVINPDGLLAAVRNGQPTEVFISNTFSF